MRLIKDIPIQLRTILEKKIENLMKCLVSKHVAFELTCKTLLFYGVVDDIATCYVVAYCIMLYIVASYTL